MQLTVKLEKVNEMVEFNIVEVTNNSEFDMKYQ